MMDENTIWHKITGFIKQFNHKVASAMFYPSKWVENKQLEWRIKRNPRDTHALFWRSMNRQYDGDWDASLVDANNLIDLNPEDGFAFHVRGRALGAKGDYAASVEDYSKYIAQHPKNADAYFRRGYAHYRLGNHDLALADFSQSISINCEQSLAYYWRATIYKEQNKLDEAIEDMNQAVRYGSRDGWNFIFRARIHNLRDENAQAYDDYNKAIELNSQEPSFYFQRAQFYVEMRELDKALADVSTAIKFNPNSSAYYFWRGYCLEKKGDVEGAIQEFDKGIELSPEMAGGYFYRANLYWNDEEWQKVIDNLNLAITHADEPNSDYYRSRGIAHIKIRNMDNAIADYQKACELSSETAEYWNTLCWYGCLAGRASEFLYAGEKAVELQPGSAAHETRGLARAITGDFAGAIEDFRFFIEHFEPDKWPRVFSEMREQWVAELEQGRNPIDNTVLQKLLEEE